MAYNGPQYLDDLGRKTIEAFKKLIPDEWISEEWMDVCHGTHTAISDTRYIDEALGDHVELVGYLNRLTGYTKCVYSQKKADLEELEESKKLSYRTKSTTKQDGTTTKPERVTIDQITSMVRSDSEVAILSRQVAALEAFIDYLEKISYEALSRWNTLQERSANRRAGFTKE